MFAITRSGTSFNAFPVKVTAHAAHTLGVMDVHMMKDMCLPMANVSDALKTARCVMNPQWNARSVMSTMC